ATDVLVLQTRPLGVRHTPLSPVIARLTDRYLRGINPALMELGRTRSPRYAALTADLAARSSDLEQVPAVCVIRSPAARLSWGSSRIGHRHLGWPRVTDCARRGWRSTARMALDGEDPEVISTPRACPVGSEA